MIDHEIYRQYMKTHDKKIESATEALCVLVASSCSSVSCSKCFRKMYGTCEDAKIAAKAYLGLGRAGSDEDLHRKLFEFIVNGEISFQTSKSPEPECTGTCVNCIHSKPHASGILFCDSFHNFTHDDGHCYRFKPSVQEE